MSTENKLSAREQIFFWAAIVALPVCSACSYLNCKLFMHICDTSIYTPTGHALTYTALVPYTFLLPLLFVAIHIASAKAELKHRKIICALLTAGSCLFILFWLLLGIMLWFSSFIITLGPLPQE